MPTITRTPLVDDDGSGTTGTILNNAWQNNLYNQIDAALAAIVGSEVTGSWTPVDKSGAGLTFTTATGAYLRNGGLMLVQISVRWPTTSNSSGAAFSLPAGLTVGSGGYGLTLSYSELPASAYILQASGDKVSLFLPPGGAAVTNATVSGLQIAVSGVYRL